jgi:phosphonate transport system substrate-binding protein
MFDYLHSETGYYFMSAVPGSFVAVVEAFGSNMADVSIINTFSYFMAREKYGATALLRVVRDNRQTMSIGQIVTGFESGIDCLPQFNGKTFAYVDASSTSGYILPKAMLEKRGIKPAETMFAMKHDNVISMVCQGQVDAGAMYYSPRDPASGQILDARMQVQTQYPDVEKKVKTIALIRNSFQFRRRLF